MSDLHIYKSIPLFEAGVVLGSLLVVTHAFALLHPASTQNFLKKSLRDANMGVIAMGLGLLWFLLLIAPGNWGILSKLSMHLGEFEGIRSMLILVVIGFGGILLAKPRDFLFVRGMALLGLMAAYPLLQACFLKEPASRLLITIWCYAVIIKCIFWVGKPYLLRDQLAWVCAKPLRWKLAATAGLGYGIAILVCAFLYYR